MTRARRSALEEREQQLAEAQALAHLGSWEWHIGESQVVWSDEMYRLYGFEPHAFEVTYEGYLSHVHPDDRHVAEDNVRGALETRQPFASDYRIVLLDGGSRWLHSRGRLVLDESGTPLKMVGTCHDITDQKLAEETRRRLEATRMRQHQALAINDDIVQGLAVASLALSLGESAKATEAIEATLAAARHIVTALLDDVGGEEPVLGPGDLRRAAPASLGGASVVDA